MKFVKIVFKCILYVLAFLLLYFLVSFILTAITTPRSDSDAESNTIYLNSNGVHLDIVIPRTSVSLELLESVEFQDNEKFLSFGWGDENFYVNTPTWGDLTAKNAIRAMFLKSTTLMHVTRYKSIGNNWVEVEISDVALNKLNTYVLQSFKKDNNNNTIMLKAVGYGANDNFYKAIGSYSCLKTCNTWANLSFKKSGLKACYWTPFDFGLINKYKGK